MAYIHEDELVKRDWYKFIGGFVCGGLVVGLIVWVSTLSWFINLIN
jgi:hypothetical protein